MKILFNRKLQNAMLTRTLLLILLSALIFLLTVSNGEAGLVNPESSTLGMWYFDENNGAVAGDSSSNGNDGSVNGAAWSVGYHNSALNFDGNDDYVRIPNDTSLALSNELTVMAWVKPDILKGCVSIINYRTPTNEGGYSLEFGCYTPWRPEFFVWLNDGLAYALGNSTPVGAGEWTHVAGTYDGQYVRLYVNGVLSASTYHPGTLNNPVGANTDIGRNIANYYWNGYEANFDGSIDEVAVYGRALGASEIWDVYKKSPVLSPIEKNALLIKYVQDLIASDSLNSQSSAVLLLTLNRVAESLVLNDYKAADIQLNTFQNQVSALINSGKISQEEGETLISMAESIAPE